MPLVHGIHHVTAFASDPNANLRFYTRVLGMRLVKRTVNFDDPLTYHLYYGDAAGTPGTLLTFFPQPRAARARHGTSEIDEVTLSVAANALDHWEGVLALGGGHPKRYTESDGRTGLRFVDPDGMRYVMVEGESTRVPLIRRIALRVPDAQRTTAFLAEVMGFQIDSHSSEGHRLSLPSERGGLSAEVLAVLNDPDSAHESMAAGTVHHVAWRVRDEEAQRQAMETLRAAQVAVTPIIDRQYFRSIYFRIPGGIVFEIATDGPGFDVDEARDLLGESLRLPPQHEPRRAEIERHLLPLGSDAPTTG